MSDRNTIKSRVFEQVQPCYLRKLAKQERKAGDFMPALPVETEKTATFSSGKMKRFSKLLIFISSTYNKMSGSLVI